MVGVPRLPGGQTGAVTSTGLSVERSRVVSAPLPCCAAPGKRCGVSYRRPKAGLPPGATGRRALRVAVRVRGSGILAE